MGHTISIDDFGPAVAEVIHATPGAAELLLSILHKRHKAFDSFVFHSVEISIPDVPMCIRTAARSTRSSVRQTFAARTAAKAGDDDGGDSDPERQTYHRNNQQHLNNAVSTILSGGAK